MTNVGFLAQSRKQEPNPAVIPAKETVQKTSLGYAGGKPNPLNPPYQGDFPLNSPLIKGARGVKNDERWVSCTVSKAGTQPCRHSCERDCAKNLVRLRWWKTQPPKSPLSGGLSHSIPLIRGTFHSIPLIRGTFHSIPP